MNNIGMVERFGTAKGAISGKSGTTGFLRYHASSRASSCCLEWMIIRKIEVPNRNEFSSELKKWGVFYLFFLHLNGES